MKRILISLLILISATVFAADKAGTVKSVQGAVDIVQGNAVMGKLARAGADLTLADILRTKRKGFAEVTLADGTDLKIYEKSRLVFNQNGRTKDGYNAELKSGKVLFRVEKMHDVAGDFRIKTTNAVIGVKGTLVGVAAGSGGVNVELFGGSAEVIPEGSGAGGLSVLTPGQGLFIGPDGINFYALGGGSGLFPGVGVGGDERGAFGGAAGAGAGEGDGGDNGDEGDTPPAIEGDGGGDLGGTLGDAGAIVDGATGDVAGEAGAEAASGANVDINIIIR